MHDEDKAMVLFYYKRSSKEGLYDFQNLLVKSLKNKYFRFEELSPAFIKFVLGELGNAKLVLFEHIDKDNKEKKMWYELKAPNLVFYKELTVSAEIMDIGSLTRNSPHEMNLPYYFAYKIVVL